ncbi:MAG: hypothetical protein LBD41_04010 [Clostridiales Family XIII bacterium]|jgi:hypothetical protein|nr:hypothetical protein [Clostridiales Family XIII bacterium]
MNNNLKKYFDDTTMKTGFFVKPHFDYFLFEKITKEKAVKIMEEREKKSPFKGIEYLAYYSQEEWKKNLAYYPHLYNVKKKDQEGLIKLFLRMSKKYTKYATFAEQHRDIVFLPQESSNYARNQGNKVFEDRAKKHRWYAESLYVNAKKRGISFKTLLEIILNNLRLLLI